MDTGVGQRAPVAANSADAVITLEPYATISGRVFDADGKPAPLFNVEVSWLSRARGGGRAFQSIGRTIANRSGEFTLDRLLPSSEYAVSARTANGDRGEHDAFALSSGATRSIEIHLRHSGMVRGTLVWADSGKPALGLQVSGLSFEERPIVDGAGQFEAKVAAGKYRSLSLQSVDRGLPPIKLEFEVRPGEITNLGRIQVPR
jgi:hypothetical protein